MAAQGRKQVSSLLLGLVGMQILLPVVLSLAIMAVKGFQHRVVASHTQNSALFVRFQLSDVGGNITAEKEFSRNGIMYDIKSIDVENGKYVVYALPDENETRLAKSTGEAGDNIVGKVLPFVFLFHQPPSVFSITMKTSFTKPLGYYARHPMMTCIKVNSPPPWRFFIV